MHTSTKNKITFLQSYVKNQLPFWYKKFGENITGVRIDKKNRNNKTQNYYSIIFNVEEKKEEDKIKKKQIIPKKIEVLSRTGKKRMLEQMLGKQENLIFIWQFWIK